jgi:hypothetical protein
MNAYLSEITPSYLAQSFPLVYSYILKICIQTLGVSYTQKRTYKGYEIMDSAKTLFSSYRRELFQAVT